MGDLLKLAGLWKRTSRAGRVYYAGRLGELRVVAFVEDDAEKGAAGDTPALTLYVTAREDAGGRSQDRQADARRPHDAGAC